MDVPVNTPPADGEVMTTARSGVQSLERAFAILETVASHADGITLAELAKVVALHNSTTFHLVRTMVNLGYVRQDGPDKRYRVGRMVFALAANSRQEIDLVSVATPILEELSRETGESTHLAILSGDDILVVARVAGGGAFQLQERHGGVRPGHATALGKVILAGLPALAVQRYLETHSLTAITPKTIVDPDAFAAELSRARESGYAYDDGEFSAEVRCVAYPVRDFTGKTIAAIGLSGPVWRLSIQSLVQMGQKLGEAAERLSAELGMGASKDADSKPPKG